MIFRFFKKKAGSLIAAQVALALAALITLPSCSGGGETSSPTVRDISPHELLPGGIEEAVLCIRGIHLNNTGWEIGSDTQEDDLPEDGMSQERQLTMVFHRDGSMDLQLPYANVVDNNDPPPREIDLTGGTWSVANPTVQPNSIMYINFRISGQGPYDNGAARTLYRGENICILLRERSLDPLMGYRFDGAVTSGKMYIESEGYIAISPEGSKVITGECNFWGQPCTYYPTGWIPEEEEE